VEGIVVVTMEAENAFGKRTNRTNKVREFAAGNV